MGENQFHFKVEWAVDSLSEHLVHIRWPPFSTLSGLFLFCICFFYFQCLFPQVTNRLLKLYCCSGDDLLLAYFEQRYTDQRKLSAASKYPIGSLTVKAVVDNTHLRLQILNARHLKPLIVQVQLLSSTQCTLVLVCLKLWHSMFWERLTNSTFFKRILKKKTNTTLGKSFKNSIEKFKSSTKWM